MSTQALLKGHQFDLASLAHLFPCGDPCVVQTVEGTFLESRELDDPFATQDAAGMIEVAEELLARLNGTAVLHDSSFRQVSIANHFQRDNHQHVMVHDEALARDSVNIVLAEARLVADSTLSVGGVPAASAPQGPSQLSLAAAHPDADDLLRLLGTSGSFGWDTQWKAVEIIRHAVGGTRALLATGWVTETEWDEFGYAANNPAASGDAARHSRRPPTAPPDHILTVEEGRQFIRTLAQRWLRSLT